MSFLTVYFQTELVRYLTILSLKKKKANRGSKPASGEGRSRAGRERGIGIGGVETASGTRSRAGKTVHRFSYYCDTLKRIKPTLSQKTEDMKKPRCSYNVPTWPFLHRGFWDGRLACCCELCLAVFLLRDLLCLSPKFSASVKILFLKQMICGILLASFPGIEPRFFYASIRRFPSASAPIAPLF